MQGQAHLELNSWTEFVDPNNSPLEIDHYNAFFQIPYDIHKFIILFKLSTHVFFQ